MRVNITKLRNRDNFLLIGIILLFLISALHNVTIYLGIVSLAVIFVIINLKCVSSKNMLIPKLVVLLLVFQNFAIGIGAHIGGNSSERLSLLTQVPFMFVAIAYAVVMVRKRDNLSKVDILFIAYLAFCILFFFVGEGVLMAKLVYLRNFTVFYMGFCVGRFYLSSKDRVENFLRFFVHLSVFAALFGVIGLTIGDSFYRLVGVPEVYVAKQYLSFRGDIPGNFKTIFMGVWVNRQAGLYYDPVNFSYFMALSCIVAYILKKKKTFVFLVICEIMTFGKGGFIILGLTICYVIAQKISEKIFGNIDIKIRHKVIVTCAIVGIIGVAIFIHTFFRHDFGTYNHFYGIITGIEATIDSPFGNGLGTAGNLIKTEEVRDQAISETGIVNMAYQIGIIGTIFFGYILVSTAYGVLERYREKRDIRYLIFAFMPMVLLIVSLFQENTFTPQCILPYMIIQGAISGERKERYHEENRNCYTIS